MSNKRTTWNELKQEMTALSPADWDEIDLKVKIIGEIFTMTTIASDVAKLIDMLPDEDQCFAYEFVKKLVLAWDPDFTKVTKEEAEQMELAEEGDYLYDDEIDWDNIGLDVEE